MPTGYTADIAKGITFNEFVWQCARAFGALVMMRDDPTGAPIPEQFAPSPFYAKHVEEAQAALSRLRSLTPEQAHAECIAAHQRERAAWADRKRERDTLRGRYEAMLRNVEAWQPPTPDHSGLKDFMRQQIDESLRFDCSAKYDDEPTGKSTSAWLAGELEKAERGLAYAEKGLREELERVENRNGWLKALRDSVTPPSKQEPSDAQQ